MPLTYFFLNNLSKLLVSYRIEIFFKNITYIPFLFASFHLCEIIVDFCESTVFSSISLLNWIFFFVQKQSWSKKICFKQRVLNLLIWARLILVFLLKFSLKLILSLFLGRFRVSFFKGFENKWETSKILSFAKQILLTC